MKIDKSWGRTAKWIDMLSNVEKVRILRCMLTLEVINAPTL
jgi:hypothetical protein